MNSEALWLAALFDPKAETPSGLKSWNGSSTTERFSVYRNNVITSLVNALGETFDVTRQLVGEDFFRAMASEFVRQHPPEGARLVDYGDEFPSFISTFPPARPLVYLADVARLEQAYIQTYHAADCPALSAAEFQAALSTAETTGGYQLQLHPALRMLNLRFAAISIWSAHHGNGALDKIDTATPEHAWVFRCGLEVAIFRVRAGDYHFTEQITAGESLEDAANFAIAADPEFDFPVCLATMLREGMITAVTRHGGD